MKSKFKAVLIITAICILISTVVAFATAGDNNDPLISLSYITDVLLPDIDSRIEAKTASSNASAFTVVNVSKGKKLVCTEGTELVLRSGEGTIIASASGGLADLTAGVDLGNNTNIPSNHHLLVPRSDGRGLKLTTDAIVLVKGSYTIK